MSTKKPMTIAVLSTEYHVASHTDVIVSRWLEPFLTDHLYGWGPAKTKVVSLFVEQKTLIKDLSLVAAARYGVPCFDTIEKAMTLGGEELAVDAVFLIGEHGDYPTNEFHQKLYPRKEFFDAMMQVFEKNGRSVPVFFDKHLSWKKESIVEMTDRIKAAGFPFMAGSSVPFSLPDELKALPQGTVFEEVVCSYYGGIEHYLFHSREFAECILERRNTTQPGIDSIIAWEGEAAWEAVDRGEFSWELLEAGVASAGDDWLAALRAARAARNSTAAVFQFQYSDGLKLTHFYDHNTVRKQSIGMRLGGGQVLGSTAITGGGEHYFPHFARFCRAIEDFLLSGKSSVPLQRTYITSMSTALCMHALANPGQKLETPELQRVV